MRAAFATRGRDVILNIVEYRIEQNRIENDTHDDIQYQSSSSHVN